VAALESVLDCAIGLRWGADCLRSADRALAIFLVAYNPLGLPLANDRIMDQDNFDCLNATMTELQLSQLLTNVISLNTVREDVDALRGFLSMQSLTPNMARAVDDGLQRANATIRLVDQFYPVIRLYLESRAWQQGGD
jgi:hypothetical protein